MHLVTSGTVFAVSVFRRNRRPWLLCVRHCK